MNTDRFDILERFAPLVEAPGPSFEGFLRRRDRKRRNKRVMSGVVAVLVFAAPVWLIATGGWSDRIQTPASTDTQPSPTVPAVPQADYVIDLNTGAKTPLPAAIIHSVAKSGWTDLDGHVAWHAPRYAASPDGTQLAYVGTSDDGSLQIFTAGIDGTGVRQATHDPTDATMPAWSPDGTRIAYEGYGRGDVRNLFVLDVATGESKQITDETRVPPYAQPQFTPDGSSLLYSSSTRNDTTVLRTVPVSGGKSTLLFDPGEGVTDAGILTDAGNGSLSPDGSLVTFLGGGHGCGPCRWVANADGTEGRVILGWISNPAGTWSPDGRRIVALGYSGQILVVDIATGGASRVAEGSAAIWLDDHTLLVEA